MNIATCKWKETHRGGISSSLRSVISVDCQRIVLMYRTPNIAINFSGTKLISKFHKHPVISSFRICSTYVNTFQSFPHPILIIAFVTRLTRRVSLVQQELLTLLVHMSSPPFVLWGSCYLIFSFMCMFCSSLFVLLSFFFWPLCCLSFFCSSLVSVSSS